MNQEDLDYEPTLRFEVTGPAFAAGGSVTGMMVGAFFLNSLFGSAVGLALGGSFESPPTQQEQATVK